MSVSYADRQGSGRQLTDLEIATIVSTAPVGGGMDWRHIHVIATILGESRGYEWARPMVWKPDTVYHLSIDRGICQFNSAVKNDGTPATYWAGIPDHIAFDPEAAISAMLEWLDIAAKKGSKGASSWDWKPLLDWQWHGYGGDEYDNNFLPRARVAVNQVRASVELGPI